MFLAKDPTSVFGQQLIQLCGLEGMEISKLEVTVDWHSMDLPSVVVHRVVDDVDLIPRIQVEKFDIQITPKGKTNEGD